MHRLAVLLFMYVFSFSCSCAFGGQDDIQGVTAVWRDFVASIRRGDYPNAHSLFSPQSQRAMPYGEFVAEYGPLSVAREMVLAKPESQATDLDEDWAEIVYGGVNPGSGRKFKVGVSFVRDGGVWGLVAARNEERERVEAGARAMLRLLWESRDRAGARDLVAAMTQVQAESPVLRYYRLETDGAVFRAFPLEKGYRTFYVDGWGEVKSVEKTPVLSKRGSAADLVVPERSVLPGGGGRDGGGVAVERGGGGMPELSEPSVRERGRTRGGGERVEFGEMAEPSVRRGDGRVMRQPVVTLPETIR